MKASYGAAYSIEPLIRIGSFQRGAMHVDQWTRAIAVFGLLMVAIIFPVQLIVVLKPEIYWISDFFYKGSNNADSFAQNFLEKIHLKISIRCILSCAENRKNKTTVFA
eukprot:jgi/Bigna1/61044/fgenesh1_kg.17_\